MSSWSVRINLARGAKGIYIQLSVQHVLNGCALLEVSLENCLWQFRSILIPGRVSVVLWRLRNGLQ